MPCTYLTNVFNATLSSRPLSIKSGTFDSGNSKYAPKQKQSKTMVSLNRLFKKGVHAVLSKRIFVNS